VIQLTPQAAYELVARGELHVIDVREPHEWLGGHLPASRLVPLGQFRANPKSALPGDGILFVCAAGIRSQTACGVAEAHGLTRVFNLSGGTRAWVKAGLPLVHDELSAVS
jgi:rhodanese-related sulfurtransferase